MMQYVEQEWDLNKVKAGAEFGLPGGKRCTVLDWGLRIRGTFIPRVLLVKYSDEFNDRLLQVDYNGKALVGPQLVIFEPIKETVARRKIKYMPGYPDDVGVFYPTDPGDDFIGEVELTITHIPGEPPSLIGARIV